MAQSVESPTAAKPTTLVERLARWARSDQLFFVFAIVIGIIAGLAVVWFRLAIDKGAAYFLGPHPSGLRVVLAPTLVGLVIAVWVIEYAPGARGSGVNQTKAALYIYDGYISFRTVVGKFVGSALAIGSGQSLGPEDPALQVGAGLASLLGRKLRLSRARLRLIAPLGAAAGLAAAFNAPIAAVLFVIEEVIGRWNAGVIGAVVLSAAAGTVVARFYLGGAPLIIVPPFTLRDPRELIAYAILGVVGGLASLAFIKLVAWLRPQLRTLPRATQYFQPAAAGLVIGLIALRFPEVLGAGYGAVDDLMQGRFTGHYLWLFLATLAALKIVATALSFCSGAPGGMFAPTLCIGAMVGGAVGALQHLLIPHIAAPASVYALVGMGAAFAGILRAPMTSVFLVVEVSGSYDIVLPLMITNTIAYVISRRYQPMPIFDLLTLQDGLELPSMEERREEQVLHVEDAMEPPPDDMVLGWSDYSRTVQQVGEAARARGMLLVQTGRRAWAGVTPARLQLLMERGMADRPLAEALAAEPPLPVLHPDQPLEAFLRDAGDWPMLPVIHRADGHLLGVVSLHSVLAAYRGAEVAS